MSSDKYKSIKTPDGRYMLEHRYIMEQHLGRKLLPSEVVHHINSNPLDNRAENLQVMSKSDHSRLHGKQLKGITRKNSDTINRVNISVRLPTNLVKEMELESKKLRIARNSYIVLKLQDKIQ